MNPPQKLRSQVSSAGSARELTAATRGYYAAADANAAELRRTKPLALVCRDGCALCCVFRVDVRAHEVFAIAELIDGKFSESEKLALMERLRAHAAQVKTMTALQHKSTNVTCPLLVAGRCSVYAVRPFGCRTHHSTDVAACQYSYDNPHDQAFFGARDADYLGIWGAMSEQANEAFVAAGFADNTYELGTALLAAITNPAAVKRWRDRKNPMLSS